jgi:tape measure domain-containing protein
MFNAGSIVARLAAENRPFVAGIRGAMAAMSPFAASVRRSIDAALDRAEGSFGQAGRASRGLGRDLLKSQAAMEIFGPTVSAMITSPMLGAIAVTKQLATGIARFLGGGFKLAAEYEQTAIAFEVFVGSAGKARRVLRDLEGYADATPFQTAEVIQAGRSLLSYKGAAETVVAELDMLGNVAAGVQTPLNELAQLYGKARVEGRVMAEDLNQFLGRGIPILEELAAVLGVAESQVRKAVEQGEVGFPEIEAAFRRLTGEGGKFAGMTERLSKGTTGLGSTFTSETEKIRKGFAESFSEAVHLNGGLESLIGVAKQLGPIARDLGERIGTGLAGSIGTLPDLIDRVIAGAREWGPWIAEVVTANQGLIVTSLKLGAALGVVAVATNVLAGPLTLLPKTIGLVTLAVKGGVKWWKAYSLAMLVSRKSAAATAAAMIPLHVKIAAVAAIALGAAYAIHRFSRSVADLSSAEEKRRAANDVQRAQDQDRLARLRELADAGRLTADQHQEAIDLVAQLESRYGRLGVRLNRITGELQGVAGAQREVNRQMRAAAVSDLQAELAEAQANYQKLRIASRSVADSRLDQTRAGINALIGGPAITEEMEIAVQQEEAAFERLRAIRLRLRALEPDGTDPAAALTGRAADADDEASHAEDRLREAIERIAQTVEAANALLRTSGELGQAGQLLAEFERLADSAAPHATPTAATTAKSLRDVLDDFEQVRSRFQAGVALEIESGAAADVIDRLNDDWARTVEQFTARELDVALDAGKAGRDLQALIDLLARLRRDARPPVEVDAATDPLSEFLGDRGELQTRFGQAIRDALAGGAGGGQLAALRGQFLKQLRDLGREQIKIGVAADLDPKALADLRRQVGEAIRDDVGRSRGFVDQAGDPEGAGGRVAREAFLDARRMLQGLSDVSSQTTRGIRDAVDDAAAALRNGFAGGAASAAAALEQVRVPAIGLRDDVRAAVAELADLAGQAPARIAAARGQVNVDVGGVNVPAVDVGELGRVVAAEVSGSIDRAIDRRLDALTAVGRNAGVVL